MSNKDNQMLSAIKQTFATIDQENVLPLFKSIVPPHLEYTMVVWSPKLTWDQDTLE